MRINNLVKYIFIVFAIGIIIYAGYRIYKNNNTEKNEVEVVESKEEIIKDIRLAICNYDTVNPLITNNKEILNIDTLIFEPLFSISSDYQLEPCLATEWSRTGDKTYVIKLETSIKWQDGTHISAKDVQFTIDRLKEGNSVYKSNVSHVISVEVIDDATVKIILDEEVPFFEYNLTFPVLSNSFYSTEDFYNPSKMLIGTGRFKITDVSSTSITLEKNKDWKNISKYDSKIESIKVNIYSTMGEVFNSFKLGNVDLINTTIQNYQDYIGTIGFNVIESPGREFDFISLNCEDKIFQSQGVRQAIGFAIDKDNIISSVYANQKMMSAYPLDYGNYVYENNNNSSGYNAEQAKKTLEDDGWEYTNNRWSKRIDGVNTTLRIRLSVNKENSQRVQVAEIIKEQLENIGIPVTIVNLSNSQYQSALEQKDYQMLITGVYNSYSPDLTYFFGENNISNYRNENILSILSSGISTKSSKVLKEKYSEIYNTYKAEVPFIGLYRSKNITITSQKLIGEIIVNNYSTFYNISNWYRK